MMASFTIVVMNIQLQSPELIVIEVTAHLESITSKVNVLPDFS